MKFDESVEVIRSMASGFEQDSKEYQALNLAANALHYLHYVFHEDVEQRFTTFLEDFDSESTGAQKEDPRLMEINAAIDKLLDS